MIVNFTYDSTVSGAPVGFTATLNAVASFFQNTFSDSVTVNISVGYGKIKGQPLGGSALGSSLTYLSNYSYVDLKSALTADAKSADDSSSVASLQTNDPTGGNYWVSTAESKALGLAGPSAALDGYVGFSSAAGIFDYDTSDGVSAGKYDFYGVVVHEVSEVMGRQLLVGGSIGGTPNGYEPLDLFHYSAPGVHRFTGAQAGYFSVDNGVTNLDNFNTNPNGDFGDWAASAGNDAALAFSNSGVVNVFTPTDIRLMDVLGWDTSPPVPDTTPPTLTAATPADNSTNVAVGANLVLTFSESVKAGVGNLIIRNAADDSVVATIAITDTSQASFSGSTLTINPAANLTANTHYYVTIASGVVQDLAGNAYAGLSAATDFDFTTAPPDLTPPTLSGTTPADNSINVPVGANLVLTFNESVKAGVGNLVIHNAANGGTVASIAITDASQVSFAGSTLIINPTSDLAPGTHYYVTMASGVVQDLAGNAYAGLSAATDFDFTTSLRQVPYDFDRDVHSDILWQNDSGQAAVWLMNGTNVVTSGNVGTADPTWHAKSAGDFDGDGKADILLQNDSGQAAVWLMNGTNVLSSTNVGSNLGTAWHVKSAGDFNGDGKSDILWQNNSGQAQIWLMNGTSVLTTSNVGTNPGSPWHVKGAGDFNGDGKSDILWQNDNGGVAIWLMNGTGVVSTATIGANPGTAWHVKGAGDFDGDGKSDILLQNDNGQAAVWLMNGLTRLSNTNVGTNLGTSWHVKGAEDFDGDSKSDIVWQNDNGQAQIWLMNGTTVLTTSNVGTNLGSSWHIINNDDVIAAGPPDTTPPTLSTTTPADNSTNVAIGANLVLTFSESVKAGSGNVVIRNAADGSAVATIAITDASQVSFSGSTLTINPTSDLAPGTHYYVTMASGVLQDLAGNAYAGLSAATAFDFTTVPSSDTTPPNLSATTPLDNSTNVAVGANLVLTFSESVKAGSGNVVIHNAADGSAVATIAITDAGQVSFAGSTLTINPTSDLAPGTHYYVTMASGVVQDLAGNAYAGLSAATAFDFTTVPPSDTTPPNLSATTPADNSTNVAVSANIVLTFSESVKAGVGNLIIRNAADNSVVATIAITDANQVSFAGSTLTINPTSDLALGTHYYVTMASGVVQDLAGNAYAGLLAATDFDFTTVPPDTIPPTLTATTPADNSANVAVGANLVLTFNESVKAGVGNLVIHNAADDGVVASIAINDAGQVSFAGSTLTINPTANLAPGTHYYVTLASGVVQDLAGNAYAGLSAATDFDFTTAPQVAALKVRYDFDGDGHSDILWQNDSGQAAVWLLNGTNVVTSANVGTADPTWHATSAGDFDGDGKADILLQNNSGQAAVWLMDGTTRLSTANVGSNLGTAWHAMSAGDFNGDGKSDILWQNDSGQAQIWLMNGTNVLSSATIGASPGAIWHVKVAGDFNGDGKADILWQNDNGWAAIWLMDGTTKLLGNVAGPNMGTSWHIKGAGDFNGDGKSDILWQTDNGQAAVWLMDGLTRLSSTNVGSNLGTSWHVKGAEDFNGDGKADILWQDDSGQAAVWLMNGTTVLTTGNVGTNPGSPWHVTANDLPAPPPASPESHANPFDHPILFDGELIF